jgi:hypothetical protein
MNRYIAIAALLALAGCATPPPISANPVQTVENAVSSALPGLLPSIATDFQDAKFNLDSAITIGILLPSDPVDACLTSVLTMAGMLSPTAGAPTTPSFTPKVTAPISLSAGSVLYILAQQAKKLAGNGSSLVPASCQQIAGSLLINAVNRPLNMGIGAITAQLP